MWTAAGLPDWRATQPAWHSALQLSACAQRACISARVGTLAAARVTQRAKASGRVGQYGAQVLGTPGGADVLAQPVSSTAAKAAQLAVVVTAKGAVTRAGARSPPAQWR